MAPDDNADRRGSYDYQKNKKMAPDDNADRRGSFDYQKNKKMAPDDNADRRGSFDYQKNKKMAPDDSGDRRGSNDIQKNKKMVCPIKIFDAPLSCPGVKHPRPVKGFRTFYNKRSLKEATKMRQHIPTPRTQQRQMLGAKERVATQSVKSAPDVRFFYEPMQLLRKEGKEERNQIFSLMKAAKAANDYRLKREPATLHTVSVPKRGVIKLTGLTYELDNPMYYDNRKAHASQREQQRHQEELFYGSALPAPSGDPHRGWLIKDKTMLKQVKLGERRLLAEQEEQENRELCDRAMYNTFIGGLLEYQMPEVPTLNSNIQKFVGVDMNNSYSSAQDKREKNNTSAKSVHHNDHPSVPEQLWTPRSLPETHNEPPTPAPSPKMAFMSTENQDEDMPDTDETRDARSNSQQQDHDNADQEVTLYQVIAKAQRINLSRIQESHKSNSVNLPLLDTH